MTRLLLTFLLGWTQPCFTLPAVASDSGYAVGIRLDSPAPDWTLWSTRPVSATVTYFDPFQGEQAPITSTVALRQPLTFGPLGGYVETSLPTPYTAYFCTPGARPGAMWLPFVGF